MRSLETQSLKFNDQCWPEHRYAVPAEYSAAQLDGTWKRATEQNRYQVVGVLCSTPRCFWRSRSRFHAYGRATGLPGKRLQSGTASWVRSGRTRSCMPLTASSPQKPLSVEWPTSPPGLTAKRRRRCSTNRAGRSSIRSVSAMWSWIDQPFTAEARVRS